MIRYTSWRRVPSDDGTGAYSFQLYREADRADGAIDYHMIAWPMNTWSVRAGEWELDPVRDRDVLWLLLEAECDHEAPMVSMLWSPEAELDLAVTRTQYLKEAVTVREMHATRRPNRAVSALDLQRHQDTLSGFLAAQPVSYALAEWTRDRRAKDQGERMRQRLIQARHHQDPIGFDLAQLKGRREGVQ